MHLVCSEKRKKTRAESLFWNLLIEHALFFLSTRPHFSTGSPLILWSFPTTCTHKLPPNPHQQNSALWPLHVDKKPPRKYARKEGAKAANQRSCKGTWTCLPRKPRGTKHKICINFTAKSSSTFQQYPSLKWCFPQGGPWQNNLPRKAQDNTRGCCNESKSWDAGGDLQRLG